MTEDALSAALAKIRERAQRVWNGRGNVGGLLAVNAARGDVPALLAVVEAALGFHRRVNLYGNAATEGEPGNCPHHPDSDLHFEDPNWRQTMPEPDDKLTAELAAIKERNNRARYPEDGDAFRFAAEVAARLADSGRQVRRAGLSIDVYPDSGGVPAWRVWVERGVNGHLIADGEFGRSSRDVRRLVKALEAALKLIDGAKPALTASPADCTHDCEDGPCNCSGVGRPLAWDLDPAALREAITRELTGKAADGARVRHDPECPGCESCDQYHTGRVLDFEVLGKGADDG